MRQKATLASISFGLAAVLIVVAVTGVARPLLLAGAGSANAAPLPYLPQALAEEARLSVAELAAIRVTAYYNCPGSLTNKLVRQSARCFLGPTSVDLFVDTRTQPGWDTHLEGASFSVGDAEVATAYAEAGAVAADWLTRFLPGVSPRSMRVVFSIKGYQIGIYTAGRFEVCR